jgi:hypothetical protein
MMDSLASNQFISWSLALVMVLSAAYTIASESAVLAKWHVNDHHYLSPDLLQPLMGNFNN